MKYPSGIKYCNICGKNNCVHLSGWEAKEEQKEWQKEEDEMIAKCMAEVDLLYPPEPYLYSKLIRVIKQ